MSTPMATREPWTVAMSVTDLNEVRDRELIDRVSGGDEQAFRDLFRRYAPNALALAVRIVRLPSLAEEVVQEVFLSVWLRADRFDDRRGSPRAWLMAMVRNRAVDAVRREETQRRRTEVVAASEVVVVDDPVEDVIHRVDRPRERRQLRSALDELPADQREVLELMYFEGLSQTRVAERLSLPLGTVKSRTLLGMRRLRAALVSDEP
jgi:RNA polymerase sigma-70 factor (ECF subfamily)